MSPSALVLLSFVNRYGIHRLFQLVDDLNRGCTLTACAESLQCDLAYLSRFVNRSLVRTYSLHPELQHVIESLQEVTNAQFARAQESSARVLRMGKKPGDSPERPRA